MNTLLLLLGMFSNHEMQSDVLFHWLACVVTLSSLQVSITILWLIILNPIFVGFIKKNDGLLRKSSLWSFTVKKTCFSVKCSGDFFGFCVNIFHVRSRSLFIEFSYFLCNSLYFFGLIASNFLFCCP